MGKKMVLCKLQWCMCRRLTIEGKKGSLLLEHLKIANNDANKPEIASSILVSFYFSIFLSFFSCYSFPFFSFFLLSLYSSEDFSSFSGKEWAKQPSPSSTNKSGGQPIEEFSRPSFHLRILARVSRHSVRNMSCFLWASLR